MNGIWDGLVAAAWPTRLAWPWALLLCLLPWVAGWRRRTETAYGPALKLPWLPSGVPVLAGSRRSGGRLARWLLVLGWCLVCVALSRPQYPGPAVSPPSSARQMMLALDLSGSMNEADMRLGGRPVTRLTAARAVLDDFLSRRRGDHVGLIIFGQQAFVLAPLTPDLGVVRGQLADVDVGLAGNDTAIGDAIALAVKRLRALQGGPRVLVLLTDGVNTTGQVEPLRAAALAADEQVRVHTIAFGGDGGFDFFGLRIPGQAQAMDEGVLQAIAQATGGSSFRARNSEELAQIYAQIERIEPVSVQALPVRPWQEAYPLWLALGLVCLVASAIAGRSVR